MTPDRSPPLALVIAIFALAFLDSGLAVAVRRRHDALRREVDLPAAGRVHGARVRDRRVAVLDAERVRRLAEHRRPAVDARLAAACAARARQRGARLPGDRRRDASRICSSAGSAIILYFRDRGWHAAGALVAALAFAFGGAASARLQHTGQVISLAYLPIALLAALARARSLVVALRRARRRGGRPDRARARSGRAARGLCAGRLRARALDRRGLAGAPARQHRAADRRRHRGRSSSSRCRCCSPSCWRCARTARSSPSSRPGAARCTGRICSRSSSPTCSARWTRKVDFWGAGGFAWNERFGMADLFLAQNMGLLYAGALAPVAAHRRRRRAAGCGRARSASSPSRRC